MTAHDMKPFTQRVLVMLVCHSSIKIVRNHHSRVAHVEVALCPELHDAYTPVNIGTVAVVEVVWCEFCKVCPGIECLMTHQHSLQERAPRELAWSHQVAVSEEVAVFINDIRISIEHGRQFLTIAHSGLNHFEGICCGERITGIEEEHIVARCHSYALVHGIV